MIQPLHFNTSKIERRQSRELADVFSIEVKPEKQSHVNYQHPPLKAHDPIMREISTQTDQMYPLSRRSFLSVLQQHDKSKKQKKRRKSNDIGDLNEFQDILDEEMREDRNEKDQKYLVTPTKETLKLIVGTAGGFGLGLLAPHIKHMFG